MGCILKNVASVFYDVVKNGDTTVRQKVTPKI